MVADHQPVSGDLGAERLPSGVSSVPAVRARGPLSEDRGHESREAGQSVMSRRRDRWRMTTEGSRRGIAVRPAVDFGGAQQKSPGAGPIIVLETVKGTIEFETYPEEAPKTVGARHRAREEELLQRPALPSRRAELPHPDRRSGDARRQPAVLVGTAGLRQADRRRGNHEEAPARPRRGLDGLSRAPTRRRPTASSSSCAAPRRSTTASTPCSARS